MKYLIPLFLALVAIPVYAETVAPGCSIGFDYADPIPAHVDGFRLYNGDVKIWEGRSKLISCDDLSFEDGQINLTAKAYNAVGESQPSNAIDFVYVTTVPSAPGLSLIIVPQ